jgi:glycosyltransferase involved in cell wall biosynthesis
VTCPSVRFLILITAHNVRPFLGDLIRSLAGQRGPDWRAVFVDDCSTDGTLDGLHQALDAGGLRERFEIVANDERCHKACNVYHAIKNFGRPDDVVALVDGDDHLAVDHALWRIAQEFDRGWEVVWGNWKGSDGSRGTSSHLHPFVSPRQQPFVTSHLFSFQRRLFDAVDEADLKDDAGRWFQAGCDVALAWPLLDQTIKRKHIPDVLYTYNRANPLSHDRLQPGTRRYVSPSQARTPAILCRRPGKPLVVDNEFLLGHLYEFMEAAAVSSRSEMRRQVTAAVQSALGTARAESRGESATGDRAGVPRTPGESGSSRGPGPP